MEIELGLTLLFSIVGALFVARFCAGLSIISAAAAAVPAGMILISCFVGGISLAIGTLTGIGILLALCAGLAVALAVMLVLIWSPETRQNLIRYQLAGLLTVLVAFAWVTIRDTSFILGDTIHQLAYMERLLRGGWNADEVAGGLASWSYTNTVVNLLTVGSGRAYYAMAGPTLIVSTFLAFISAAASIVRTLRRSIDTAQLAAMGIVFVVVVVSAFYVFLLMNFANSNVLTVAYTSLFVSSLISLGFGQDRQRRPASLMLLPVWLIGIAFSRTEGAIYASFFALWLASSQALTSVQRKRVLIAMALPVVIINLIIIARYFGSSHAGMLSPLQHVVLTAVFGLWIPFAFAVRFVPESLLGSASTILALVLWVALVVAAARVPDMPTSLTAMGANIFQSDLWGALPFFVLVGVPFLLFVSSHQTVRSGLATMISLVCLIALVSLGREPYYFDIADSGHRLLGSIGPACLMIILAGVVALIAEAGTDRERSSEEN